MTSTKLILVIGATGAQGQAVIDALLEKDAEGLPSPYSVRALTRDPTSKHAAALAARGVECVQDFDSVARALDGAYGVWYAGMRIFEIAKQTRSLRHYVWSNLPYVFKGRVGEWLQSQTSIVSDDTLSWSIVTTGPYMELLKGGLFGPFNVRKDGTVVFAAPIGDAELPMIALKDLGWWARWTFDHRAETSAQELNITSEYVGWNYLVETFTRVTGKPAVFKRQPLDEWWLNFDDDTLNNPVANESAFWRVLGGNVFEKDINWLKGIHPTTYTLEKWMREEKYDGPTSSQLKNSQDDKGPWVLNREVTTRL
ncbi:NAD-P-binding protein [Mycena rebaudengoi]|nr:NAD-P-binding protein [Mycena rebaudengoi]